jgi:hypothetical protein
MFLSRAEIRLLGVSPLLASQYITTKPTPGQFATTRPTQVFQSLLTRYVCGTDTSREQGAD